MEVLMVIMIGILYILLDIDKDDLEKEHYDSFDHN